MQSEQGPTVEHGELHSTSYDKSQWKNNMEKTNHMRSLESKDLFKVLAALPAFL